MYAGDSTYGMENTIQFFWSLFNDSKLSVDEFAKAISTLYGEFSDRAAHGVEKPKMYQ